MDQRKKVFGALVPHTKVGGLVRHYVELGNVWVSQGHSFYLFTPDGLSPDWIFFKGDTRPFEDLQGKSLDVLFCSDPPLLDLFQKSRASLKIFYLLDKRPWNKKAVHERQPLLSDSVENPVVWVANASDGPASELPLTHRLFPAYTIVPGGVNLAHFQPATADVPPSAKRFPSSSSSFTLLTVGSTRQEHRGLLHVLRAFEHLHDQPLFRSVSLKLIILSKDRSPISYLHEWFHTVSHWFRPGHRENIQVLSEVFNRDLPAIYQQADILVSERGEGGGWNHPVAEAMACQVPVICTPSGTQDIAFHLETAFVVPGGSSDKIEAGLELLYQDKILRDELKARAYNKMQSFSWLEVSRRLEALFQNISIGF